MYIGCRHQTGMHASLEFWEWILYQICCLVTTNKHKYMYICMYTLSHTVLLVLCGAFINGPYSLITSAVASDLVC